MPAITITPPLHSVPAATGIQVTVICCEHVPICFPSGEQIEAPAVVQVPVEGAAAPVDGALLPDEPEEASLEPEELVAGAGAEDAAGEAAVGAAAAGLEAAAGDDAAGAEPESDEPLEVPPDAAGAAAEADEPLDAPLAAGAELSEVPDEAPPPDALHLAPVGGAVPPLPSFSTEGPGFGKARSLLSTVVQSVGGMLAMNISGKDVSRSDSSAIAYSAVSLRGVSRLLDPPVTLTEAQFMYISLLPTLLNHVHANV